MNVNQAPEIAEAIRFALEARAVEIAEGMIEKFVSEFRQSLRNEIATVALKLFSNYSIERMGANLKIEVRDVWKNEK